MIALGLTSPRAEAKPPFSLREMGALALVLTPAETGASAKDRLGLLSKATLALPSFLPFSAVTAVNPDAAAAWAARHEAAALAQLDELAGTCQMVVELRPTQSVARSWLQQRARQLSEITSLSDALAAKALRSEGRLKPQGGVVNCLIAKSEVSGFGTMVASAGAKLDLRNWSALISGPWAPLAFHGVNP